MGLLLARHEMNKILSVIMVVLTTLGMPIYSLAGEKMAITQDSQEKSGNSNVDYNLEETYTAIFPASVIFTDTEKSMSNIRIFCSCKSSIFVIK